MLFADGWQPNRLFYFVYYVFGSVFAGSFFWIYHASRSTFSLRLFGYGTEVTYRHQCFISRNCKSFQLLFCFSFVFNLSWALFRPDFVVLIALFSSCCICCRSWIATVWNLTTVVRFWVCYQLVVIRWVYSQGLIRVLGQVASIFFHCFYWQPMDPTNLAAESLHS